MTPILESEMDYDTMQRHAQHGRCSECGALLTVCSGKWHGYDSQLILACSADKSHDGISRPATTPFSETPAGQLLGKTPKWRKEQMTTELGTEKSKALAPYAASLSLTEEKAREIIATIWPKAPEAERIKAAIVCHQYGLNPLMNHLFLVEYKGQSGSTWAMIFGIKSNRLIALREGRYSYDDDTPRAATNQEIERKYGKEDWEKIAKANYVSITKVQDDQRRTATGFGLYPRTGSPPKGIDKGNTPQNMADIRSERQALDRLRPGALPAGEVVDERYIEGEYEEVPDVGLVDTGTGEISINPELLEGLASENLAPVFSEEETAVPEEPFEPAAKDESPVNADHIGAIKDMIKQIGWTMTDLGGFMNKDMGWKIKDLSELRVWQYHEIKAMVNRGLGSE